MTRRSASVSARRRCSMGGRRALTLVEVLVSLSVIAVLIAILVPGLARARSMARDTACRANLSTFGKAIHAYMIDCDGLPVAHVRFDLRKGQTALVDALGEDALGGPPRLGEDAGGVYRCPEDEIVAPETGMSYDYVAGAFLMDSLLAEEPLSELRRRVTGMYEEDPSLPLMDDARGWHNGAKNALFFDGSVSRSR